jgi:hypothetical protein
MGSESMNQREVLDNKIKQNLHDEVEWMWRQYQNSGYPENPNCNFRKYCETVGYRLLAVRNRKDGYGDPTGKVPHFGDFVLNSAK